MLTDLWRDVVTLMGFLLTALGLAYAIWQIRITKSAAEAAQEAAEQAFRQSQMHLQRFAAATARRYVSEAQIYVGNSDWGKAALRLSDLAEHAAHLAGVDADWTPLANECRIWAAICSEYALGRKPRFSKTKWADFLADFQSKIDSFHTPFIQGSE